MKSKLNFNAVNSESLDSFGVVELNSTQVEEVNGGNPWAIAFGIALLIADTVSGYQTAQQIRYLQAENACYKTCYGPLPRG